MRELKDYLAGPIPHVLAHRGLHEKFPENTLAAFHTAVESGCTHVETDARVTSDGVAILFHDDHIDTPEGPLFIERQSLERLQQIDLGGGHRIPTLHETLVRLPSTKFNIDIKSARAAVPVADVIEVTSSRDRVLIASFNASRRKRTVRLLAGVATSASGIQSLLVVLLCHLGFASMAGILLKRVDVVQLPLRILGMPVFSKTFIRMCHRAHVLVHAWTINDPVQMKRLFELGVDGVVSDRCDVAAQILRSGKSGQQGLVSSE